VKTQSWFATLAAIAVVSPALARPSTNFDTGPEGWTFPASTEWQATGGNADGFLFGGIVEDENITAGAFAPAEYLGDWSGLNENGSLSFDYRRIDNGDIPRAFFPLTVQIAGPGGNATWTGPIINVPTDWTTYTIPIDQGAWSIDDGNWEDLLANVAILYIQLELVVNDGVADDTAGLDNVVLVPAPSAFGALALGLVARRRRR
jgi:hypothetical protein